MNWIFSLVDYFQLEERAERLKKLPWMLIFYLVGAAFVLSSLFATILATFLSPNLDLNSLKNNRSEFPIASGNEELRKNHLSDEEIQKIERRNLFNSEGVYAEEGEELKEGDLPKTDLPIKVVGIIYGGDPFSGMVTVENTQKRESIDSYLVGDYLGIISKDAKILEIHRRRIVILNNEQREYAELVEDPIKRSSRMAAKNSGAGGKGAVLSGSKVTATKFSEPGFDRDGSKIKISADYKDQLLNQNLAQVLQDAKAEPYQVDGVLKGFRMTKIQDNSIYTKAGLQNDDIVEEINGVPLNDIPGAIRLLNQLRNEKEIEVRVKRGDSSFNINLNVM